MPRPPTRGRFGGSAAPTTASCPGKASLRPVLILPLPEVPEPVGGKLGVAGGVLDVAMTEPFLDGAGVVTRMGGGVGVRLTSQGRADRAPPVGLPGPVTAKGAIRPRALGPRNGPSAVATTGSLRSPGLPQGRRLRVPRSIRGPVSGTLGGSRLPTSPGPNQKIQSSMVISVTFLQRDHVATEVDQGVLATDSLGPAMLKVPMVDAVWARQINDLLAQAGRTAASILRQAGSDRAGTERPGARIPSACYAALLEVSAEKLADDLFGLRFSVSRDLRDAGLLAYVVLHSATYGDAVRNLEAVTCGSSPRATTFRC